jgi:hypothetical protein
MSETHHVPAEPNAVINTAPIVDGGSSVRAQAFQTEIESLKLKGSSAKGEKLLLLLGSVCLAVGLGLALYAGVMVQNNLRPADQRAYMATGSYVGIVLVICGAALFVRFSLARFMRFWLIRLVHESRANTDRIVEALNRRPGGE